MYCIDKAKVSIYGSKKDINSAKNQLDMTFIRGVEYNDRMIIQNQIDAKNIKATILYSGNTVWSFNRTIRDFKRYKNGGIMTNYLYNFLILACGSIAHYSKAGWVSVYGNKIELKRFFLKNEFGQRVYDHVPVWKTDAKRIVREIENILGIR